eukprot:NODE_140_length_2523_cov_135.426544_g136_i0.p1 GENE.NODE_140_length_2523_cov_135.426544_g136_i0~~NODE_140_length_2523_cov_135.426544_g136_i0.p1  ORF type:complete len:772 (+),score=132.91 NODE_140_length_2523_cov_135.426544_g136_i0:109-2424(+)
MEGDQVRSPQRRPGNRPNADRPCFKLSVELLATYKRINELFYEAKRKNKTDPRKAQFNDGYDDENGNYVVQTGEEIAGRYIVQDMLGKGSFGVVVKAHDHRREECVAIKIIKNKVQFFHQAKVEIEILTMLNAQASEEHNVVKLKKVFSWKEHLCLVFELLSFNLYDLLKYTRFAGVSLNLIRKFAAQILKTLEFLSAPHMGIIHCDLKPENILLRNPKRSAVKVIDFGSSCFQTKKMFKYIQSRFYRSPEVILGLPYDVAIDMWSLACILVEMHTGQPLFDGKDEPEQLLKQVAVLGSIPQRHVENSPKKKQFFVHDAKSKKYLLQPPGKDPSRYPRQSLENIIGVYSGGPGGRRKDQAGHSESEYLQFLDLVRKMLAWAPRDRITPKEALRHEFLQTASDANATSTQPQTTSSRFQPSSSGASAGRSPARTVGSFRERSRSRDRPTGTTAAAGTTAQSSSSSSTAAAPAAESSSATYSSRHREAHRTEHARDNSVGHTTQPSTYRQHRAHSEHSVRERRDSRTTSGALTSRDPYRASSRERVSHSYSSSHIPQYGHGHGHGGSAAHRSHSHGHPSEAHRTADTASLKLGHSVSSPQQLRLKPKQPADSVSSPHRKYTGATGSLTFPQSPQDRKFSPQDPTTPRSGAPVGAKGTYQQALASLLAADGTAPHSARGASSHPGRGNSLAGYPASPSADAAAAMRAEMGKFDLNQSVGSPLSPGMQKTTFNTLDPHVKYVSTPLKSDQWATPVAHNDSLRHGGAEPMNQVNVD